VSVNLYNVHVSLFDYNDADYNRTRRALGRPYSACTSDKVVPTARGE